MNTMHRPSPTDPPDNHEKPLLLVVYASVEGQSRKIAEYAAAVAISQGWRAEIADVRDLLERGAPHGTAALLVAASVHVGRHSEALQDFVQQQRSLLAEVPATFLSVSLHASDPEGEPTARRYLGQFLEETGWQPTFSGPVAGALPYSRYGFFKRMLMKQIARRGGMPADTSRDHEFTDWDVVRRFTETLLEHASTRNPLAPPRD